MAFWHTGAISIHRESWGLILAYENLKKHVPFWWTHLFYGPEAPYDPAHDLSSSHIPPSAHAQTTPQIYGWVSHLLCSRLQVYFLLIIYLSGIFLSFKNLSLNSTTKKPSLATWYKIDSCGTYFYRIHLVSLLLVILCAFTYLLTLNLLQYPKPYAGQGSAYILIWQKHLSHCQVVGTS